MSFKFAYFATITALYFPTLLNEPWWPTVLGGLHGADCHDLGTILCCGVSLNYLHTEHYFTAQVCMA